MQIILLFLAGLLGAVIGSFFSVLLYRLPRGEDIVFRRSHCPSCKKTLGVGELIPIVSFIVQGGRCRHCRKALSRKYPAFEVLTAGMFMLATLSCNDLGACFYGYPLPVGLFFLGLLLFIGLFDYFYLLIPDFALSLGLLSALLARIVFIPDGIASGLVGAAVGGGFFWILVRISDEQWMGMGDAKLGAFLGILLGGYGMALTLLGASMIGGVVALLLIVTNKKRFGDQLPFGPFLISAALLVIFFSPLIKFHGI